MICNKKRHLGQRLASGIVLASAVALLSACDGGVEQPGSSSATAVSSAPVVSVSSSVAISSSAAPVVSSSSVIIPSSSSVASSSESGNVNTIILQENRAGFCAVDGTIDSNNMGFSGDGFANTDNAEGQSISWQVNAQTSGPATLEFRFANGGDPRSGDLSVNSGANGTQPVTLANTGGWTDWATESVTVDLVQGLNNIKVTATSDQGLANIDSLTVTGAGVSAGDCGGVASSSAMQSSSSAGGSVGVGEPPAQCEAMGWATRKGRSSTPFNVTGGGNAQPIIVKSFADLSKYAGDGSPRVIYIDGTLGGGWSGRSGDRLIVKSNKTIIGMRPGTQLKAPIQIKDASNVIIKNIVIKGPGSSSDQAWDNIVIEGASKNIWVDHSEFWNGQDGNADVVKGADNVTFTWNIFGYTNNGGHNFSNLVASSDNEPQSVGKLNITLMFNHFRGVAQRQPRCRFGDIHVVNNLFTKDGMASDNGISAGKQCRVLVENNHFIGIKHPVHKRSGGKSELRGMNIFENTSGDTAGNGGPAFEPPYEYKSLLVPASQVKGLLQGKVGATLSSPSACE